MTTLLIVLSVVDAVLVIAALAVFLTMFARAFRSTSAVLAAAAATAGSVDEQLAAAEHAVRRLNRALEGLRAELEAVADRAEDAAARR